VNTAVATGTYVPGKVIHRSAFLLKKNEVFITGGVYAAYATHSQFALN
jgi:hypothetical protein